MLQPLPQTLYLNEAGDDVEAGVGAISELHLVVHEALLFEHRRRIRAGLSRGKGLAPLPSEEGDFKTFQGLTLLSLGQNLALTVLFERRPCKERVCERESPPFSLTHSFSAGYSVAELGVWGLGFDPHNRAGGARTPATPAPNHQPSRCANTEVWRVLACIQCS